MADSFVQVAPDSTGKKLDTAQLTQDAGDIVQRQRAIIADNTNVDNFATVTEQSLQVGQNYRDRQLAELTNLQIAITNNIEMAATERQSSNQRGFELR